MTEIDLTTTGVIILTLVAVAWGGTFLLRVSTGGVPTNGLQRTYFRAGHAHAGMLVTLGLVIRILVGQEGVPEWARFAATGVLFAAILMPLGFFLSVLGRDPQRPNAWRWSIWAGAAVLVAGLIGAGAGMIAAP
ncbi:MAG TPA: hypothetical protein GXZ30_04780 [Propionibacterium sp.]|nr:hypothetical protein [Propionibacterium sp.]